ncbi:hypothetical protein PPUN109347_21580 [Pseudomonas putida]|nr:hypothetical protein PPUN109347_21580 [Pseudomonas putida]
MALGSKASPFYRDTIMQHSRREQHFQVATLYPLDPLHVDTQAINMGQHGTGCAGVRG